MHELGLARSILDIVASIKLEPGERYAAVRLRVGEVSGVEPGALRFGLEALAADRGWRGVEFRIERASWRRRCVACSLEFEANEGETGCPRCREPRTALASGDELEIASIEVESPA